MKKFTVTFTKEYSYTETQLRKLYGTGPNYANRFSMEEIAEQAAMADFAKEIEHLDPTTDDFKTAVKSHEQVEDYEIYGPVSDCCSANVVGVSDDMGLCSSCHDHCNYLYYTEDEEGFESLKEAEKHQQLWERDQLVFVDNVAFTYQGKNYYCQDVDDIRKLIARAMPEIKDVQDYPTGVSGDVGQRTVMIQPTEDYVSNDMVKDWLLERKGEWQQDK